MALAKQPQLRRSANRTLALTSIAPALATLFFSNLSIPASGSATNSAHDVYLPAQSTVLNAEDASLSADVNGDGRADIVGFGDLATNVALGQANGTFGATKKQAVFSIAQGWTVGKHLRLLADVNGDGRADIVGFGDLATNVALGQANGTFGATKKQAVFSIAQGWTVGKHLRLLADVNGDKRADIVAFGDTATYVALGQANGTFAAAKKFNEFSTAHGWTIGKHLRALADVNGDGRADIVAFGDTASYVALGQTNGTFAASKKSPGDFSFAQGWRVGTHVRLLADVNGDKRADIVGFGSKATYVAYGQTNGTFTAAFKVASQFSLAQGWTVDRNPRTLADVNGDNRADVVGFADRATLVATYDTRQKVFALKPGALKEFCFNQGWRVGKHLRFMAG